MRRKRTIYFNDARHYYLFVFEPPMKLEDAWRPVDEVAGTPVDTFIYGVARGDGLYYPSKVGRRFKHGEHGVDSPGFHQAAYWRVWHNMQSLIDRGLDPLTVLIDRAHEKGMDFFGSLRLGESGGLDPSFQVGRGGRGFGDPEVRDFLFALLEELATQYETEGVELDCPGGPRQFFRDEDVRESVPVMTEWVKKVADMVRNRPGEPGQVGARVFPTEALNLTMGLDVRTWLREGLLDYVTPLVYGANNVECNMPIDWLVEAAHEADAAVYPMVQPDYHGEDERRFHTREHASPAMMRAAAANFWDRGADGMYTWFLRWPLGDAERRILADLGDPDLAKEGDKHYLITGDSQAAQSVGYETPLPLEIAASEPGTRHRIPFYIADDVEGAAERIRQVLLKIKIYDLVAQDRLTFLLNGQSLAGETCLRDFGEPMTPYNWMWLEFHLENVRPRKGHNLLEISLDRRAEGMISPLRIEDIEFIVEYGSYPSALSRAPAH